MDKMTRLSLRWTALGCLTAAVVAGEVVLWSLPQDTRTALLAVGAIAYIGAQLARKGR